MVKKATLIDYFYGVISVHDTLKSPHRFVNNKIVFHVVYKDKKVLILNLLIVAQRVTKS